MTSLLTEAEAAEYLRVSARLMRKWREDGTGPTVTRFGPKTIRYSVGDLDAYAESKREQPTTLHPIALKSQKRRAS